MGAVVGPGVIGVGLVVGGGVTGVGAMVEVGPDVGDAVGLKVGLSPPQAARSNTRVMKMPVRDNRGKDRTTDVGSKKLPLLLFELGVTVRPIGFTLLIAGDGMPHRFQGGVHFFLCLLDRLQGITEVCARYRGHSIKSLGQ